ncbi:MAG: 3-hydroxyacyl-ACP dehydratase FabZ family protein [Planctomycetota bacterium]|jgi:3-hydroxyacyl-[acyl-carrier-protein] dehydratase
MPESEGAGSEPPAEYPFILVDKLLAAVPGERAVGLRNVTANDPLVAGGGRRPFSLRRSFLVDAFAQLVALALAPEGERPAPVEISKIDSMSFLRSPVPGDQVVLTVELTEVEGGSATRRAKCRAEAGGELVAEGEIEFEASA